MIKAEVIADSRNEYGNRLTTMIVTFPRYILAEFNTHRMFSRNSASSRAIPFEKLIKSVKENPFIPIAWQKNHTGMQGTEYCTPREHEILNSEWLVARNKAIERMEYMAGYCNPTKQMINRMLEAYMYHTCIVSATEWENFFALRCPQYTYEDRVYRSRKDYITSEIDGKRNIFSNEEWLLTNKGAADIHMMALAEAMWDAYNESTSRELKAGEWHIPFFNDSYNDLTQVIDLPQTEGKTPQEVAVMIATARCAGVSYTVVGEDGKEESYEKLIKRHNKLASMGHWSPFEHCARAMDEEEYDNYSVTWPRYIHSSKEKSTPDGQDAKLGASGNFFGFVQYRKMFEGENIETPAYRED
jgi:hypothetical protein